MIVEVAEVNMDYRRTLQLLCVLFGVTILAGCGELTVDRKSVV